MSPLRSRRSSARFTYEDIENALGDVENVVTRSESEDPESNYHHGNEADNDKIDVDSDERDKASSPSVEHIGRCDKSILS